MGVYEDLGVRPIINAWGTITLVGGSRMDPRVLDAMTEASRSFVNIEALHQGAGIAIAQMFDVEAACVTSGAAAGLAIAAAACLAHDDTAKILQLPDTRGLRDEMLVLKAHRILYDQSLLLSGGHFVEVGVTSHASIEQIEAAISERSALFFYAAEAASMRGSLPLRLIAAVLAGHDIPLIVDAAAELPPASNVVKLFDEGADLVVLSGGKEIRGPQSSGIILGRKDLVRSCAANCFPNFGVGRGMKTDKETIVGLVKAVELFCARDYDDVYRQWEAMVAHLVTALSTATGLKVRRGFPSAAGIQPTNVPRAYIEPTNISAATLQVALRDGEPSVAAGLDGDEIVLNPQCLEPDEIPALIAALIAAAR